MRAFRQPSAVFNLSVDSDHWLAVLSLFTSQSILFSPSSCFVNGKLLALVAQSAKRCAFPKTRLSKMGKDVCSFVVAKASTFTRDLHLSLHLFAIARLKGL